MDKEQLKNDLITNFKNVGHPIAYSGINNIYTFYKGELTKEEIKNALEIEFSLNFPLETKDDIDDEKIEALSNSLLKSIEAKAGKKEILDNSSGQLQVDKLEEGSKIIRLTNYVQELYNINYKIYPLK